METLSVSTKERYQLIDITDKVSQIIEKNQWQEGLVLIFVPHSTCAILLTENETGLKEDWISVFKKIVDNLNFKHNQIDNNADSHILSGLIGQGKVLPLLDGKLKIGTWQQIFLVELDGPRTRNVIIKFVQ